IIHQKNTNPEISTLSLHDALPICAKTTETSRSKTAVLRRNVFNPSKPQQSTIPPHTRRYSRAGQYKQANVQRPLRGVWQDKSAGDRKSTRLNSSHQIISYAVFCLK